MNTTFSLQFQTQQRTKAEWRAQLADFVLSGSKSRAEAISALLFETISRLKSENYTDAEIYRALDQVVGEINITKDLKTVVWEAMRRSLQFQRELYALAPDAPIDLAKAHALSSLVANTLYTSGENSKIDESMLMRSLALVHSGSRTQEELKHEVAGITKLNLYRAGIFANTIVSGYDNSLSNTTADQAGLNYYLYFGGLVEHSRAFCIEHVNHVFTKDQIMKLDNGQKLPVLNYLGGYNCIHQWIRGELSWFKDSKLWREKK